MSALRAEVPEQLEAALDTMDAIDREVLALRHFEEVTYSEVAKVLDIQQKVAGIRYARVIRRLKGILSQIPGLFGGLRDSDVSESPGDRRPIQLRVTAVPQRRNVFGGHGRHRRERCTRVTDG